jgi:hypothetical protein
MCGTLGSRWAIFIADNCNANSNTRTNFGAGCGERTYSTDSDVSYFFTGSEHFRMNEIEVFETAKSIPRTFLSVPQAQFPFALSQRPKLFSFLWRRSVTVFRGTATVTMEFRCAATIAITALHPH